MEHATIVVDLAAHEALAPADEARALQQPMPFQPDQ
jgi:hypothetical protein